MNSDSPDQKSEFPQKKRKSRSEGKAPTTADDNGDEVQAFFSLVDRIQAVGKLLKKKRLDFSSAPEISTSVNVDSSAMKLKSAWKLSLEWEDFSYLTRKESQKDLTCSNASTSMVSEESDIKTDKSNQVKSFDLNVEANAEHSVPATALTLFR
ncbi:hypothetical protein SUGI_0029350 [Cryptomeria japonica]|nr:hypothetical protein SUGI_0029350 [Cryptomeria japonica]